MPTHADILALARRVGETRQIARNAWDALQLARRNPWRWGDPTHLAGVFALAQAQAREAVEALRVAEQETTPCSH